MQHFLGLAGMNSSILLSKKGFKHSDDTKRKISEARAGKTMPNMARDVKGEKNPMYGKSHSFETKEQMSASKSGSNNPMYGKLKDGRFELRMGSFLPGEDNPKYKGTYILDIETNDIFGPMLKADVLIQFHLSSRKYYEYLNTGKPYREFIYSHYSFKVNK
jgi:group I intron endonuclease